MQLDLFNRFDADIMVENVDTQAELAYILEHSAKFSEQDRHQAISAIQKDVGDTSIGVGVKKILLAIETAKQDESAPRRFAQVISDAIIAKRPADHEAKKAADANRFAYREIEDNRPANRAIEGSRPAYGELEDNRPPYRAVEDHRGAELYR